MKRSAALFVLATLGTAAADEPARFNRDIRPILSENCFHCHGPDAKTRKAELRLDTEAGLRGAAGKIGTVVPGQPERSKLFQRVTSTDHETLMPPAESGKQLKPAEVALLRRWIAEGATFEGHWAFQPLQADRDMAKADDAAAAARIDAFVRTALAAAKRKPAPEADRTALLRRLHFDLVGLPPREAEVAAFLADARPDAYARQVDRLLASPHFGERFAMWWLDLVRYADTVGYHGDQDVSVSAFRDYTIAAFNANLPFDRFTREQLAGDLLPNPTVEQRIASGYNRLGMMSAEGGVQDREYLAKYMAERVRNASGAWLGVTLGCAECHDHKFDPLSTKDFYRFGAFFADLKERGLYSGANATGSWGPSIKLPTPQQTAELATLDGKLAAAKAAADAPAPELAAAQAAWERSHTDWTILKPDAVAAANGSVLKAQPDGVVRASGKRPNTDAYTLTFKKLPKGVTAFRLEALPDEKLPGKGAGRAGNGNFVLTEFVAETLPAQGKAAAVALKNPTATYEQTGAAGANPYGKWAVAAALDGDAKGKTWGWAVLGQEKDPQAAVFETAADFTLPEGAALRIVLRQEHDNPGHLLGKFRVSVSAAPRPLAANLAVPLEIAALVKLPREKRTEDQQAKLAAHFRATSPLRAKERQAVVALEAARKKLDAELATTLVAETVPPRMVRVLARGNWMDDKGETVQPAFPAVFAAAPKAGARLTRLDLANWLVAKENPLTARATANRLWKLLFGAGLSRKLDDLGAQGEWPSHPELLDFLAARFIEPGWDVKRLLRTIVLSETYRQSSVASKELREADPGNRLLARQARFRLDAELVRDNALAVSGLLVAKVGGKSVKPYQPPGYWAYLNFPTREWRDGAGADLYRRGLYTHWQRQYLHPSLAAFDAPSREECTADRPRSNTPLQALALLNDPTYVEAARAFAESLLRTPGGDAERFDAAFRRALSRPIAPPEAAALAKLLAKHRAEYAADPAAAAALLKVGAKPAPADLAPAELAAWTSVARVALNLHEAATRP